MSKEGSTLVRMDCPPGDDGAEVSKMTWVGDMTGKWIGTSGWARIGKDDVKRNDTAECRRTTHLLWNNSRSPMAETRRSSRLAPFVAFPLCKSLQLDGHPVCIIPPRTIAGGSGRRALTASWVHGLGGHGGLAIPPLLVPHLPAPLQIVLCPCLELGCDDWLIDELRRQIVSLPQRRT